MLPDPTAFESPLLMTNITIALDEQNHAALVRQEGLGGVIGTSSQALLDQAWAQAEQRIQKLRQILNDS